MKGELLKDSVKVYDAETHHHVMYAWESIYMYKNSTYVNELAIQPSRSSIHPSIFT